PGRAGPPGGAGRRGRAAGDGARRRPAPAAPAGARPDGVPDRPGGADQRPEARRRGAHRGGRGLPGRGAAAGGDQRRAPGRGRGRRRSRRGGGGGGGGPAGARGGGGGGRGAAGGAPAGGRLRRPGPPAPGDGVMGGPGRPLRVVIADDQALVRAGFRLILEAGGGIEVAAEAADGEQAVSAVRRWQPDVVLMDVRMPRLDGLDATRRIVQGGSASRVLMLPTFALDEYVYAALRAGASGFLLKDVTPEHLVAAVHLVAAGDALLAPSITRRLIERFVRGAPPAAAPPGASAQVALA